MILEKNSKTGMIMEFSILVSSEPNYYPLEVSEVLLNGEDGTMSPVTVRFPEAVASPVRVGAVRVAFSIVAPLSALVRIFPPA